MYIGTRAVCWVYLNPCKRMKREDDVNCGNTNFKCSDMIVVVVITI